jgi:chitinase
MKVPYLYDGDFWIGYDNEESVAIKVGFFRMSPFLRNLN